MSEPEKRCWRCKLSRPLTLFSIYRRRPGGINSVCRTCETERYALWREKNRARYNAKAYKHMAKYPERTKARGAVEHALKSGKLVRGKCEKCGDEKVHAHHKDYSKPLEVTWLCQTHHEQEHHITSRRGMEGGVEKKVLGCIH